jgi:hypothetical protein
MAMNPREGEKKLSGKELIQQLQQDVRNNNSPDGIANQLYILYCEFINKNTELLHNWRMNITKPPISLAKNHNAIVEFKTAYAQLIADIRIKLIKLPYLFVTAEKINNHAIIENKEIHANTFHIHRGLIFLFVIENEMTVNRMLSKYNTQVAYGMNMLLSLCKASDLEAMSMAKPTRFIQH